MSSIQTRWEEVSVDGDSMPFYVAEPKEAGKFPVVFVFQEIFGVSPHIREVTERIAKEGYVCFAPDVFYRTGKRWESGYGDYMPGMERAQKMTPENFYKDMTALKKFADTYPKANANKIGAIGFCMGGRLTFGLSAKMSIQAGVSFYGGGIAQHLLGQAPHISSPMLFFWGGLDKHIPLTDVKAIEDALKKAGKKSETVVYENADHGFFCDDPVRGKCNAQASEDAWKKTKAFFEKNLKG